MDLYAWITLAAEIVTIIGIPIGIAVAVVGLVRRRTQNDNRFEPYWSLIPDEKRIDAELLLLALMRSNGLFFIGLGVVSTAILMVCTEYLGTINNEGPWFVYGGAISLVIVGALEMAGANRFGGLTFWAARRKIRHSNLK